MFLHVRDLFGPVVQTTETLQCFLRGSEQIRRNHMKILPRFVCGDGFSMSVQASDFHHCTPRCLEGPYTTVECACPSTRQALLMPFILRETDITPTESCYRHVPVSVVVNIINAHGGLAV